MIRSFTKRATVALALVAAMAGPASAPPAAATPTLGPVLAHADWLRDRPSASDFAGKVVVLDVFTFGCYNCANVRPNLASLYAHRRGSVAVVGIHTPETPYERDRVNVRTNLAQQGVVWPVAIDNDQALWNAYGVDAWPTQLIFDKHGRWRKTIVGDSQDADVDAEIDTLLDEK